MIIEIHILKPTTKMGILFSMNDGVRFHGNARTEKHLKKGGNFYFFPCREIVLLMSNLANRSFETEPKINSNEYFGLHACMHACAYATREETGMNGCATFVQGMQKDYSTLQRRPEMPNDGRKTSAT